MGENSKIEWTDATWNPVTGCTKVSPGCKNCYAERMAARLKAMGIAAYRDGFKVTLQPQMLEAPLHWHKGRMVFVNSMSDLFHADVPFEYIDRVFAVMALCPQHKFQVLTKRPERMAEYCKQTSRSGTLRWNDALARITGWSGGYADTIGFGLPLPNVWLGTSVENQEAAHTRIPHLLHCPAAVRFLSCEPLLADLGKVNLDGIHWVICGGESGPGARPMHPDWARGLRDQCAAAGVAYFFKQWGEWLPWSHFVEAGVDDGGEQTKFLTAEWDNGKWDDAWYPDWSSGVDGDHCVGRVGKKKAGRLLDGVEHNGMPERQP